MAARVEKVQPTSLHWLVLVASAGLEMGWAIALDESHGFTRLVPSLVFVAAAALSMVGLSWAMRAIPISVAYSVWTGLGAALTVIVSMLLGHEQPSIPKLLFIAGIIGCVVGLKFAPIPRPATPRSPTPPPARG